MPDRPELALAHLRLRLAVLRPALHAAVARRTARSDRLTRPDLAAYCITPEQATLLLEDLETPPAPVPFEADTDAERDLRRAAAAGGLTLPLDALTARLRLGSADRDALLLIAAPEIDPAYTQLYAYLSDDLRRRWAGPDLLAAVLGGDIPATTRLLADHAPLTRYGLIRAVPGGGPLPGREFRLGDGVLDALLGHVGDLGSVTRDPGEVLPPPGFGPPAGCDPATLERLGTALASGRIDLAGVWCPPGHQRDAVLALAAAAGRPLRTLPMWWSDDEPPGAAAGRIAAGLRVAAALNAIVWIPADQLTGLSAAGLSAAGLNTFGSGTGLGAVLAETLTGTRIPAVVTGTTPWRPLPLLAGRAYAEMTVPAADHRQRQAAWSSALPALGDDALADLAVRFRMSGEELRAVASVAESGARFAGNGRPGPIENHLPSALATVTRGRTSGYARAVTPRRTLDDLVLPAEQLGRIREIEAAFRAWPRVAETWGFGRRGGDAGVKALFTGEPGTGKTLSAEILAGRLGLDLLTVDLSQVVSKWIGETEKNLEQVFRQAEESQAVVFFDEADALFGKRGEVRHGTDRYANLEVGYLLQRLEASSALVILASNLQENIDVAFTRRFHFVVHFGRPGYAERLRLWELAFPPEAPLASDMDLETLAHIDMTGAAVMSAARSAALSAASSSDGRSIEMRDVVAGVARQFQREARLLRPDDLGRYAHLLNAGA